MYSWVVHFLSYFISIFRERRRERESRGGGGIVDKLFIYFFYVNSFLYTLLFFYVNSFLYSFFTIIIIKCKVSFSSHSSSSHYSIQGFVFISFQSFVGGGVCCKYLNK